MPLSVIFFLFLFLDSFSGSSSDWVSEVLGVPYSYLIELRDRGDRGFVLPESEIEPTGREAWAAWQVIVGHIMKEVKAEELRSALGGASVLHGNVMHTCLVILAIFLFQITIWRSLSS